MSKEISLIVAYSIKNKVIGKDNRIPWFIPHERTRFREITQNNVVIMGRHTAEEIFMMIGKALPNRVTIIVSSSKTFEQYGCETATSFASALKLARKNYPDKNVYIAGGSNVYREALPIVEKMYVTEVDYDGDGDKFFPDFDENSFTRTEEEHFDGTIPYTYVTYKRK